MILIYDFVRKLEYAPVEDIEYKNTIVIPGVLSPGFSRSGTQH